MSSRPSKRYWMREQVRNYLRELKGAKPATIVIRTEPRLNKNSRETGDANPFLNNIYKVSEMQVFLNFDYENSVNRQRSREDKESSFQVGSSWGEHDGRVLVVKDGQDYIQCKLERKLSTEYRTKTTNQNVPLEELTEYMSPRSRSRSQGTDKEILVIRPKLDNLVELRIDRQVIVVID